MNHFVRSLSPAMRCILAGRLRLRYNYIYPETIPGYHGVGIPRTETSPQPFLSFASDALGVGRTVLSDWSSAYKRLSEPFLRTVVGTSCDAVNRTRIMKRLSNEERQRYMRRFAEPLDREIDPLYLQKITAYVDKLAPSPSTLEDEQSLQDKAAAVLPAARLAVGSKTEREILANALRKVGFDLKSNSPEAVKAALSAYADQL